MTELFNENVTKKRKRQPLLYIYYLLYITIKGIYKLLYIILYSTNLENADGNSKAYHTGKTGMEHKGVTFIMGNINNLTQPFTSEQSREKAAENGQKGGIASGEAKRAKRLLRDAIGDLLNGTYKDPETGKEMSGTDALTVNLFKEAMKGGQAGVRAFEVLRDTAGQKPIERVMFAEVDPDVMAEVDAAVEAVVDGDEG